MNCDQSDIPSPPPISQALMVIVIAGCAHLSDRITAISRELIHPRIDQTPVWPVGPATSQVFVCLELSVIFAWNTRSLIMISTMLAIVMMMIST